MTKVENIFESKTLQDLSLEVLNSFFLSEEEFDFIAKTIFECEILYRFEITTELFVQFNNCVDKNRSLNSHLGFSDKTLREHFLSSTLSALKNNIHPSQYLEVEEVFAVVENFAESNDKLSQMHLMSSTDYKVFKTAFMVLVGSVGVMRSALNIKF